MIRQNERGILFAKGDFLSWVISFEQAGFIVLQPLPGVIQICASRAMASESERLRLVISVGIHGDETAPIEMMAQLLDEVSKSAHSLAVDLMIVVGNLDAIAQATRFIHVDLNRLFVSNRRQFNDVSEAHRADQLMQITASFFDGYKNKLHLDLHTAIRASVYPTFAILPGKQNPEFVRWLGEAGIAAVVLNPDPSVTFSSWTSSHLDAVSCTAELGRIGKLGENDLTQFMTTQRAIAALLRSGSIYLNSSEITEPHVFRVTQELIKRSEAFRLTFDSNTKNFTEFLPNTILAIDNEMTYSVGATPEYVLFPNPDVRVGMRAGLMVVPLWPILN